MTKWQGHQSLMFQMMNHFKCPNNISIIHINPDHSFGQIHVGKSYVCIPHVLMCSCPHVFVSPCFRVLVSSWMTLLKQLHFLAQAEPTEKPRDFLVFHKLAISSKCQREIFRIIWKICAISTEDQRLFCWKLWENDKQVTTKKVGLLLAPFLENLERCRKMFRVKFFILNDPFRAPFSLDFPKFDSGYVHSEIYFLFGANFQNAPENFQKFERYKKLWLIQNTKGRDTTRHWAHRYAFEFLTVVFYFLFFIFYFILQNMKSRNEPYSVLYKHFHKISKILKMRLVQIKNIDCLFSLSLPITAAKDRLSSHQFWFKSEKHLRHRRARNCTTLTALHLMRLGARNFGHLQFFTKKNRRGLVSSLPVF